LRLRTDVDHPCSGHRAKDTGFLEAFVAGGHDSPDGSTMRSQETRLVSISPLSRLAPQPGIGARRAEARSTIALHVTLVGETGARSGNCVDREEADVHLLP